MILNKIKQFFLKNKKEILLFSFFIIFIFSVWDSAFAEWETTKEVTDKDTISQVLLFILKIASTLIWALTWLIALLLNPGWINGTIFGFDVYLKEIWVLISNIVYFIFAFILIAISFMNIVGNWTWVWELKQALPKFVIWVIMVPFTWFFVQFVLSISAFLTVAVLDLPHEVMQWKKFYSEKLNTPVCTTFVLSTVENKSNDEDKTAEQKVKDNCQWETKTLNEILNNQEATSTSSSIAWIMNIYTYQLMKIDKLQEFKEWHLKEWLKSLVDAGVHVLFSVLFIIVYLILMVALFMSLFARWTWLWIYAMFSPIFWLLFFFWKSKEWVSKISPVEFIKLALVPVYVSAALAFWLIFLFVASSWLSETDEIKWDNSWIFKKITLKDWKTFPWIEVWWMQIVMNWPHWAKFQDNADNIFKMAWNGLWQLILELFWLAILWIAVMAALKSSDITGKVIEPISAFWTSIGSLVAKAPQYAPIIPTPGGGMTSAAWLKYWTDSVISTWENEKRTKQSKWITSMFWWNDSVAHADNASNLISKTENMNNNEILSELRKSIKESKDASTLATTPQFKNALKQYWDKLLKDDKSKLKEFDEYIWKSDKVSLSKALHIVDRQADEKGFTSIYNTKTNNWKAYDPKNLTHLEGMTKWGSSVSDTSKTAPDATTAANQAAKNVKIWKINYNISKDWDTLKFDNTKNWWADFDIKKTEISDNWKITDEKIKEVLKNAKITEWVEEIVEEVKKKFKETPTP